MMTYEGKEVEPLCQDSSGKYVEVKSGWAKFFVLAADLQGELPELPVDERFWEEGRYGQPKHTHNGCCGGES